MGEEDRKRYRSLLECRGDQCVVFSGNTAAAATTAVAMTEDFGVGLSNTPPQVRFATGQCHFAFFLSFFFGVCGYNRRGKVLKVSSL